MLCGKIADLIDFAKEEDKDLIDFGEKKDRSESTKQDILEFFK